MLGLKIKETDDEDAMYNNLSYVTKHVRDIIVHLPTVTIPSFWYILPFLGMITMWRFGFFESVSFLQYRT
jgi:hypothetical protein